MNKALKKMSLRGWETKRFPAKLCTVRYEREPEVKVSKVFFMCIVVDKRFNTTLRVSLLKPYVWKGVVEDTGKEETLFGWVDADDNTTTHKDHAVIRSDYETVVAWKKS